MRSDAPDVPGVIYIVAITDEDYRTHWYWFSFTPVIVGMILHQLYETSKKHRETRVELAEARAEIERLESELAQRERVTDG